MDFVGPFISSFSNQYILTGVAYVSKWVEVVALPTSDAKMVTKFLKKDFHSGCTPRVTISDGGCFCD